MKERPALDELMRRGTELLGSRLAILGGAMTWVSDHQLVAAISNAGGFGVLACGAMTPELLDAEIGRTFERTRQPFGVNLIVMHPQLDALIETCIERGVSHVVLAGGLPKPQAIARIREAGRKVLAFAPSAAIGKRLVRNGADGLIIEGSEAGGHVGPVSTSVLAQEILPVIREVPVFVAGGIGHGDAIAAFLRMGAAGVQIGTLFVCAEETNAHPAFKQRFIRASARDAVTSAQIDPEFKVIPVRAIANDATKAFQAKQIEVIDAYRQGAMSFEQASLEIEHFWAGALRRAVVDGDVDRGSLMAGQSVGMVKEIRPVTAIINELADTAEAALAPQPRSA
jgi:enoyl-[acyl-carrier protein] reductase II